MLAPPREGCVVRLYQLKINCHGAQLAQLIDSSGEAVEAQDCLGPGGGLVLDFNGHPWSEAPLGLGLDLHLSHAVQTSGRVWYTQREG